MSHDRPRLGRGYDWHHVWHNRVWYKGPDETLFREHPAFVIPVRVFGHIALHQNVLPPPKPDKDQMEEALAAVALWLPSDGRLQGVEIARDVFDDMGDYDIANNLQQQLNYMGMNRGRATQPVHG